MIPKKIQQKLDEGRSYRAVANIEVRLAGDEPDDRMIVEGYATTFNDPYVLWSDDGYTVIEQIDRNAFDNTDMADVIMQYDHEGRVFARISNGTLELNADEHGMHIRADLGGTEIGRQLYEEIKGGYTDKMSFAFTVTDEQVDRQMVDNKRVITRLITKIGKLYDVSAVSVPANDGTSISARSFCDGIIKEELAETQRKLAEERTRKLIALKLKLMEV